MRKHIPLTAFAIILALGFLLSLAKPRPPGLLVTTEAGAFPSSDVPPGSGELLDAVPAPQAHGDALAAEDAVRAAEAAQRAAEEAQAAALALAAEEAARAAQAATQGRPVYVAPSPAPPAPTGCAYEALIRATFPEDADYMVRIAMRESGCNPCAFYPSRSDCSAQPSSAKGLFQLLSHDAMIEGICGSVALWSDPTCNARVARALYDSAGRRPWGG